uniref:PIH1D1/2/3 CS-like domain-containing protein n=1 Tax=Trichobilharzia regenti TaxID=157069 RepID=A0AA85J804_TRIRE|nr:unnamed protein product [Trichobilharzia regenti]
MDLRTKQARPFTEGEREVSDSVNKKNPRMYTGEFSNAVQQKQAIISLCTDLPSGNVDKSSEPIDKIEKNVKCNGTNGPPVPDHTTTYCSGFNLSICRDSDRTDPPGPLDCLVINIKFPCLSLSPDNSEKPIDCQPNLKLLYEMDAAEGTARFDKSTRTLCVKLPITKQKEFSPFQRIDSVESSGDNNSDDGVDYKDEEEEGEEDSKGAESNSTANTSNPDCVAMNDTAEKRRRRKRRKRRNKSKSSNDISENTLNPTCNGTSYSITDTTALFALGECLTEVNKTTGSLINSHETILGTENLGKSEVLEPTVKSPIVCGSEVKVKRLKSSEMILSEDRRLAPVLIRQDTSSLTILLDVRNILADSVGIIWTDRMHSNPLDDNNNNNQNNDKFRISSAQLLLLITFSSRGSSGCTMDWGTVLQCSSPIPSNKSTHTVNDVCKSFEAPHKCGIAPYNRFKPEVISSRFSETNGILIIRKPICNCDRLSDNQKSSEHLANQVFWWESITAGRSSTTGAMEGSFIVKEVLSPFVNYNNATSYSNSHMPNVTYPNVCTKSETTVNNNNNISSKPQSYNTNPGMINHQQLNSLRVTSLSNDCCSIEWNTNDKSENNDVIENNNTILKDNPLSNINQSSSVGLNNQVNKSNGVPTTSRRLRCNSTPSNSEQIDCLTAPVLKGILKHRSISECSGDEVPILDTSNLRGGSGLAGDNQDTILSERDICLRQSLSTDKLSVVGTDGYQRLRSVSFSKRNQHVGFSPEDTVEALHNALCIIRKKVTRQTGHHQHTNDGNSNHSDNKRRRSTKKDGELLNDSKSNTCKFENGSSSSSKNELDNKHSRVPEICDNTNPSEHLHDSVFHNCPTLNTPDSNNNVDFNQFGSLSKKNLESNVVISSDISSTAAATTTTKEEEEILRIIPEGDEADSSSSNSSIPHRTHYTSSTVPLTTFPILELDEE